MRAVMPCAIQWVSVPRGPRVLHDGFWQGRGCHPDVHRAQHLSDEGGLGPGGAGLPRDAGGGGAGLCHLERAARQVWHVRGHPDQYRAAQDDRQGRLLRTIGKSGGEVHGRSRRRANRRRKVPAQAGPQARVRLEMEGERVAHLQGGQRPLRRVYRHGQSPCFPPPPVSRQAVQREGSPLRPGCGREGYRNGGEGSGNGLRGQRRAGGCVGRRLIGGSSKPRAERRSFATG
mmetsp:Transcript_39943/g.95849  ORF Transcript_39943/g.95849 Transcript_39943/m.95849 type:complete len:231 (+) Transcript_39943:1197-1889(+)